MRKVKGLYSRYINGYDAAAEQLNKHEKANQEFARYMQVSISLKRFGLCLKRKIGVSL